jgi:hypothetical protein
MNPEAGRERPVLLAYDGSDHAKAAIEQAGRLLRPGRRALVLTVWQPLQTVPFFGGVATPSISKEVLEEGEKGANTVAEEGAKLASAAGFDVEPLAHHVDRPVLITRLVGTATPSADGAKYPGWRVGEKPVPAPIWNGRGWFRTSDLSRVKR